MPAVRCACFQHGMPGRSHARGGSRDGAVPLAVEVGQDSPATDVGGPIEHAQHCRWSNVTYACRDCKKNGV